MTPEQAAKQLGVNGRTAYNWVKKDQKNPSDTLEPSNGKNGGRLSTLARLEKLTAPFVQILQSCSKIIKLQQRTWDVHGKYMVSDK